MIYLYIIGCYCISLFCLIYVSLAYNKTLDKGAVIGLICGISLCLGTYFLSEHIQDKHSINAISDNVKTKVCDTDSISTLKLKYK